MPTLQNINRLIVENQLESALAEADEYIAENPADDKGYFLRGKLHWRAGRRSEATSDYARAAAINPESPAVQALEQARAVADFFNPDLLNP